MGRRRMPDGLGDNAANGKERIYDLPNTHTLTHRVSLALPFLQTHRKGRV
jgi:hypothetical protein